MHPSKLAPAQSQKTSASLPTIPPRTILSSKNTSALNAPLTEANLKQMDALSSAPSSSQRRLNGQENQVARGRSVSAIRTHSRHPGEYHNGGEFGAVENIYMRKLVDSVNRKQLEQENAMHSAQERSRELPAIGASGVFTMPARSVSTTSNRPSSLANTSSKLPFLGLLKGQESVPTLKNKLLIFQSVVETLKEKHLNRFMHLPELGDGFAQHHQTFEVALKKAKQQIKFIKECGEVNSSTIDQYADEIYAAYEAWIQAEQDYQNLMTASSSTLSASSSTAEPNEVDTPRFDFLPRGLRK